jgi:DNA-binding IscR family transcriptional regulator
MGEPADRWTFLSNHAHVLVCLAEDSDSLVREIADRVGITERRVNGIISELEAAGIVRIRKVGRRNSYTINRRAKLRHPLEAHKTVDDLLKAVS